MANRYLVPGGTGDYDSTTNWSTVSGGASGASKPTAADAIIIDANSANAPLTVNTTNNCLSFNASNYTGTLTLNDMLQTNGTLATGNITLSAGMTITGSGTFAKKGTGTTGRITSNGAIFDCNFSFTNTAACTTLISGAMQVNKNLSSTLNSTAITTLNTGTISVGGNVIHNNPLAGSAVIQLIGSNPATITQVATRYLGTNLVINKGTGAWNQVDLYWGASGRTLTYTSGVSNHTGTLFVFSNATLNTSGMTWNIVEPQGSVNLTSVCSVNKIGRTSVNSAVAFGGTFGFNTNEFEFIFTSTNATSNIVFANVQYNINTSIVCTSANLTGSGGGVGFRCNSGTALINLKENAFMKMDRMNFLNIAASNKTLRVLRGIIGIGCQNCFKINSNINQYNTTR